MTLRLENGGPRALDSVVVLTAGRWYPLGRLAAGAARTVHVVAGGEESGIDVEHWRAGRRRLSVPNSYFERRSRPALRVRVAGDTIASVKRAGF